MDIYEFAMRWQSSDWTPLVRFPMAATLDLPELTRELLCDVGLPPEAAPCLGFGDDGAGLPRLTEAWGLDDSPLEGARVLGDTGNGDAICVREGSGAVVVVSHDSEGEEQFCNASVVHLAYFLLAYRAFLSDVVGARGATRGDVDRLREHFAGLDPAALEEGAFWTEVLDSERTEA